MSTNSKFLLTMFFIVGALAYAGTEDFKEENRAAHRAYCERVMYGLHYNYRDLDCGQNERNMVESGR